MTRADKTLSAPIWELSWPYPQKNYPTTPLQYLLCKGPHKLSYDPHRASLSALQVSIQESNDTGVETTQDKRKDA